MKTKRKKPIALLLIGAMLLGILSLTGHSVSRASGYGIGNPRTTDGVSTWDCVWFGNYWQEDTNGDGTADKNDRKQPIKWRVLSVDGDDAFLVADKNLDCQLYNDTYVSVTWENCTMRSWLNGYGVSANVCEKDYTTDSFMDNAFTSGEQSAIRTAVVVNEDNFGTEGGNDTQDKVYLLSIGEVTNPAYGFTTSYDEYAKNRRALNTDYAKSQGACTSKSTGYVGNGYWWLRSPGDFSIHASYVCGSGYVDEGGVDDAIVDDAIVAVRPALHLNLSSTSSWSYAGTVSSDGGADEQATPAPAPGNEDTDVVDKSQISMRVSECESLRGLNIEGAKVTVEGIGEAWTDSEGMAQIPNTLSEPSAMKKIQVTKDGYRDYIYYTTVLSPETVSEFETNRFGASMRKKKEGDDTNPYISTVMYYRNERAKTCGLQSFERSDQVTFRVCGVWNEKKPGYYCMYQSGAGGKSFESEDGIFRINIGKDFSGRGDIYVKMVAEDGTESELEQLYIRIPEGSADVSGDGGVPILNEIGESGWQTDVPFLNNDKLSFDLGNIKTSIKREGSKVRVMLGTEASGDVFKDEEWADWKKFCESQPRDLSLSQWKNVISSDNLDTSWTAGAQIKATGYGWLENDLSKDSKTPLTGGIQVVIDMSTTFKQQYVVGVVPVYMEQSLGVNGKLDASVTYDISEEKFGGSTKLEVTPSLSVGGGVGVLYVATVGAEGTASMPMEINFPKGLTKADLVGSLSLKASVLGFDYKKELVKATYPLYPAAGTKSARTKSSRSTERETGTEALYDMDHYALPEKEGSETKWYGESSAADSRMARTSAAANRAEKLLQTGTSELAEPMLVQEGDTTLAVFLTEDSSRPVIHRTKLVYTLYDRISGEWSSPVAVEDNGTGDFQPDLTASNGKIAVSWLDYDEEITDDSSMKDALQTARLCHAVWNESKGKFVKSREILSSTGNASYNSSRLCIDSQGDITEVGLKNTEADIFGTAGDNILFMTGTCEGGTVEQEFNITQGLPVSYDVTAEDSVVKAAVCVDTDADLTTLGDREIYLFSSDGDTERLTDNSTFDSAPQYAEYRGNPALFWYTENGYRLLDSAGKKHTILQDERANSSEDFTVVNGENGETALVWFGVDENAVYQLTACLYDGDSGKWSRQVVLSDSEKNIFRASGYFNGSGDMEFLYRKGSTIGEGSLYALQVSQAPDIQIVDAYMKDGTEIPGEMTKVFVGVKNTGTKTVDACTVSVDGQDTEAPTTILPGESALLEAEYTVPDSVSQGEIPIEVTVENDCDTSNNTFRLANGYTDFSVAVTEDEQENGKLVHVAVTNSEAVPADAVLEIRKNSPEGELVSSDELGTLNQGDIVVKDFAYARNNSVYEAGADALYYVVTSDVSEKYNSNNYGYTVLKEVEFGSPGEGDPTTEPSASSTPTPTPTVSPTMTSTPAVSPTDSPAPIGPPKPTAASTTKPTSKPTASPAPSKRPVTSGRPVVSSTGLPGVTPGAAISGEKQQVGGTDTGNAVSIPGKPVIKSVKNIKGRKIKIKLKKKVKGAAGYQIQYARNKKFTKAKKSKDVGAWKSSKTIAGLKKGKTYYVRVRAYQNQAGKKVYGKWSKVKKVKIKR